MVGFVVFDVRDFVMKVLGRIGPAGLHRVVLESVQEVEGQFGRPAYEWRFVIPDGEHAGSCYVLTTGTTMLLGTALGDLLEQLYARPLKEGDELDPIKDFVGKQFEARAFPAGKSSGGVIKTICPVVE